MVKDDPLSPVETSGLSVRLDLDVQVASLRFFAAGGAFASAVQRHLGAPLPATLSAIAVSSLAAGNWALLAWRSPTESILLCSEPELVAKLSSAAEALDDGCVVVHTGGARVLRAAGEAVADLFARMGGQATLPAVGEARRSRLADVPILALHVQAGEILLVVDRPFAEHAMNWIRSTALDLATP
jgi:hypothetical protein